MIVSVKRQNYAVEEYDVLTGEIYDMNKTIYH